MKHPATDFISRLKNYIFEEFLWLFCTWLAIFFASNLCVVAQTPDPHDYTAYNPVTKGIFANSTYPAQLMFRGEGSADKWKSFRLKNGLLYPKLDDKGYIVRIGVYLKSVHWADLTGDQQKEAIVIIGNICDCSGVSYGVYIYEMHMRKPTRLLWSFRTGDRALGGLRRVYGSKGQLVVELFGVGSGPGVFPKNYQGPMCCTDEYTQRRYQWNRDQFVQQGRWRVLSEK